MPVARDRSSSDKMLNELSPSHLQPDEKRPADIQGRIRTRPRPHIHEPAGQVSKSVPPGATIHVSLCLRSTTRSQIAELHHLSLWHRTHLPQHLEERTRRSTLHCDCRKSTSHDRQEFESGHAGHIKIG